MFRRDPFSIDVTDVAELQGQILHDAKTGDQWINVTKLCF